MRLRLQTYEHTDCTDRTILVRRNRYAFAEQAGIGTPVVQNSTHDNLRLRLRRVVLFPLFSLRSFRPRIAQRMLYHYLSKSVDCRINIWYFYLRTTSSWGPVVRNSDNGSGVRALLNQNRHNIAYENASRLGKHTRE